MSKPARRCFDLSTIEGVRVFGFAVAEAAKRLTGQNIAEAKEFKAASDRIANLVIELGGDRLEKEAALSAEITDFNFRDPCLLGYLEKNKFLRMTLMDLSKAFKLNKDFRPADIRRDLHKVPLGEVPFVRLVQEMVDIAHDRLAWAKDGLLDYPVAFEDLYEQATLEALFSVSTRGSKRVFDYREHAAHRAVTLWYKRKSQSTDQDSVASDIRACIREVLKPGGEFTIEKLDAPSRKNQIKISNPKDTESAVLAVEKIAKKYIKIDREVYGDKAGIPALYSPSGKL